MYNKPIQENEVIKLYKDVALRMLHLSLPQLGYDELNRAVDYSLVKRCRDFDINVDNNYKKTNIDKTALEMADYILTKRPIMSMGGVLFERHANSENPYYKLIDTFINNRVYYKNEMFKHPKGSEEFEKYNLLQLLAKIDCNAIYGCSGMYSSIYYNLYVASSITRQGKSCISAALLAFEQFLANNVLFSSLNDIITFIDNVITEPRVFRDCDILDENISLESAYFKIMSTCGFNYYPSEDDMVVVWDIMKNLNQEDLNRLYYKNNLYDFMDNSKMTNALINILQMLNHPFLDPNKPPKEIKPELDALWDIISEYVYYHYQYMDRIERADTMVRDVVIVVDTDSNILSVDAWYRFVLQKVYNIPMKIKHDYIDPGQFIKADEYGDYSKIRPIKRIEPEYDYDFYSDEIIEKERLLHPGMICPQDGLRYSIINIIAYMLTKMILDYMERYTKCSFSWSEERPMPLYRMKNEFLFKRLLNTDGKKNYADKQEMQEGHLVPHDKGLAVMGLPINKNGLQKSTRDALKGILYDDILSPDTIDQMKVLKDLIIFEKSIFENLASGKKDYYKPTRIKSIRAYENPMRIQGVKASVIYNELALDGVELIDLSKRNGIDIVKVDITHKNIDKIKETYPEVYNKLLVLLDKDFVNGSIDSIAIPINEEVPKWILQFIDYSTIIDNNVSAFPLESIGLYRMRKSTSKNSHSNIVKL